MTAETSVRNGEGSIDAGRDPDARAAAVRDVLRVVNTSRGDELPVFQAIVENVARLCKASRTYVNILRPETGELTFVANSGEPVSFLVPGETVWPLDGGLAPAVCVREARVVHIPDLADTDLYRQGDATRVAVVDQEGVRSFLAVPLMLNGAALGCIALSRREVRPFAPDEIALVEAFAEQAVIAIENVRQFHQVQIRLAREAATREILEVISQSRDNEMPVFEIILDRAARLCSVQAAGLQMVTEDGRRARLMCNWGDSRGIITPGWETDLTAENPNLIAEAILAKRVIRIDDLKESQLYKEGWSPRVELVDKEGVRSWLIVPLLRDGIAVGSISLSRHEVKPFTDDEIALIETFAGQAVIAIDNARQFREVQTRLEREAATREILEVISRSRDDDAPVFEAIVQSAARLCDTPDVGLHLVTEGGNRSRLACVSNADKGIFQIGQEFDLTAPHQTPTTIREARVIHVPDTAQEALYLARDPIRVKLVEENGVRSRLSVPLLKGGTAFGCINLNRHEVRPFTDSEIALVETFAEQAVIAIDNVRQFREIQIRLEREAATREVLEIISLSRDDEKPVFSAILERAARLCGAPHALLLMRNEADTLLELVASNSARSTFADSLREHPHEIADKRSGAVMALESMKTQHLHDVRELFRGERRAPQLSIASDVEGMRTVMLVPLVSAGRAVGVISVYKLEVAPFSESEISLIETFAQQAVIAIQNVRQFREIQTRLEREAASREILQVISQSRDDEAPVFDMILGHARRLCDAPFSALILARPGDAVQDMVAHHGAKQSTVDIYASGGVPMDPARSFAARAITEKRVVHLADMADTEEYRAGIPNVVSLVDEQGIRTNLFVPLITPQGGIGCFILFRHEVRPFSDDQIALVETFAEQAVIAIENVRQFRALEDRTAEVEALNAGLEVRVEEQVGEIERMGRLKRFLPAAVADTVVSSGSEKLLSSHRALLGVLFCDIRGFTAFCETAEPEETIEVLQTYHEEMGKLISDHGAGVDHRMGDGIMVLFNDPLPCDDPCGDALRLAIAMRARMAELCARWQKLGHRLGFGVGISLGYATVGMVGSEGRYDYTASGTAVNLAARLCERAADGEILLSPRAAIALEDVAMLEPADAMELKGFRAPVDVFRALAFRA